MTQIKPLLTFAATLAFVLGPFMTPDFGGFDPDLYPIPQIDPPVQPAGYAFAIWGVIYVWLLVSAGFGLIKRANAPEWRAMRSPLIVSLVIGAAWLPVAMVSPVWAVIMIFAMLATALMALGRVPRSDPWFARAPIALYAGWLTAASFAGLGLLGAGYGLGLGQVGWAYLCLIGAFIVALYGTLVLRPDAPLYPLGVAWALIAITVQNWGSNWGVASVAALGAGILLVLTYLAYDQHKLTAQRWAEHRS
ncbi:hypothetical protein [Celeribacter sp.]|uniref:hypothetical protein n=1 Tax=Celeribacter sp. TaxID=1890673 RepID=UPI003A8E3694